MSRELIDKEATARAIWKEAVEKQMDLQAMAACENIVRNMPAEGYVEAVPCTKCKYRKRERDNHGRFNLFCGHEYMTHEVAFNHRFPGFGCTLGELEGADADG